MTLPTQVPVDPASRAPLAGITVLDLSRIMSGPFCGRVLSDLGATVIKVEPPGGDMTRFVPPFVDGLSAYYAQANAGKKNLSIDLKSDGAADVVRRLASSADVLIENFRPGTLAKFGLDAETLRAEHPALIYCSISGWGQQGPWSQRRAYGPIINAEVGALELDARLRSRTPEQQVNQHADLYCAVLAANAVLAALLHRTASGLGQHLDISLGQASIYTNEWAAASVLPPTDEYFFFDTWNHRVFPLGDGSFISLIGHPADFMPSWLDAFGGDTGLLADPRFSTREARDANLAEVIAVLSEVTRGFPDFASIEPLLSDSVLGGQVRSIRELSQTPWAEHASLFDEVAPGLSVPRAPWQSDSTTVGVRGQVPTTGADNDEVLRALGLSDEEIADLYDSGAISRPHLAAPGLA